VCARASELLSEPAVPVVTGCVVQHARSGRARLGREAVARVCVRACVRGWTTHAWLDHPRVARSRLGRGHGSRVARLHAALPARSPWPRGPGLERRALGRLGRLAPSASIVKVMDLRRKQASLCVRPMRCVHAVRECWAFWLVENTGRAVQDCAQVGRHAARYGRVVAERTLACQAVRVDGCSV
jgi:hypothetical protein